MINCSKKELLMSQWQLQDQGAYLITLNSIILKFVLKIFTFLSI